MKKFNTQEEFLSFVTDDCFSHLSEEAKTYIKENPDPFLYHLDLGIYIRNQYIYSGKYSIASGLQIEPDDFSFEVIVRIIKRLIPGFNKKACALWWLLDDAFSQSEPSSNQINNDTEKSHTIYKEK